MPPERRHRVWIDRRALNWRYAMVVLLGCLIGYSSCATQSAVPSTPACERGRWSLWDEFVEHFVQQDGRVIDATVSQRHSTSEGQSYAMFFALVANDRAMFEQLWRWSKANLGAGAQLPAWQWGRAEDGSWGVLDPNSASDADLWYAYTLLEAGRLWGRSDYTADGMQLLRLVREQEVALLPGVGAMLLPGRLGFACDERLWRFNPSYLPLPLLRYFSAVEPVGPWDEIAENVPKLLSGYAENGLIPDWIAYEVDPEGGGHFIVDPEHGDRGSYDAIRSYMWAGMIDGSDRSARDVLHAHRGLAKSMTAEAGPPERVVVTDGVSAGEGPFGFSAAMLPYLRAMRLDAVAEGQRRRVDALMQVVRREATEGRRALPYYDYVLALFGLGWDEGRYRFQASGRLQAGWDGSCDGE